MSPDPSVCPGAAACSDVGRYLSYDVGYALGSGASTAAYEHVERAIELKMNPSAASVAMQLDANARLYD